MITPFEHQKRIWHEDPLWCGIFQGTGSCKTITSLGLAEGLTFVVVEKQLREEKKFQLEWEKMGTENTKITKLVVLSKEEFRRDYSILQRCDTLIIDEADNFYGVLPDTHTVNGMETPKTSQMHDALVNYLTMHAPKRFYMLTATPASKPMHVYAIGKLLGKNWNYYQFRSTFYFQTKKGYRTFWIPKNTKELKDRLAKNIKALGYTGGLADFFDVPEQSFKTIHVDMTVEQFEAMAEAEKTLSDPMALRSAKRTIENGVLYGKDIVAISDKKDKMVKKTTYFKSQKIDHIVKLAEEFPKMLIFADYIGQVESIALALAVSGHRNVGMLTGDTKDREHLLKIAETSDHFIIVASAKISAGYEWKSCPTVVFASKSNRYRNYEQALGRVQRGDAIKKNLYIHLVLKGGMDEACHESIMAGKDFQELVME